MILGGFQGEFLDIDEILAQESRQFPVAGSIQPTANDQGQPTPTDFSVLNTGRAIFQHVQFQPTDRDIAGLDIFSDWLDRQFDEELRRNTAAADAAAQASTWPCW